MQVNSVTRYNNEHYRLMSVQHTDQRHEAQRLEDRRAKFKHEVNEAERIAQNRRMNRPGQNIDKFA